VLAHYTGMAIARLLSTTDRCGICAGVVCCIGPRCRCCDASAGAKAVSCARNSPARARFIAGAGAALTPRGYVLGRRDCPDRAGKRACGQSQPQTLPS